LQGKAQQELSDSRAAHTSLQNPQKHSGPSSSTTALVAASTTGVSTNTSTNISTSISMSMSSNNNDATTGKKRPVAAIGASGSGSGGATEGPQVPPPLRDAPLQVDQLR